MLSHLLVVSMVKENSAVDVKLMATDLFQFMLIIPWEVEETSTGRGGNVIADSVVVDSAIAKCVKYSRRFFCVFEMLENT